MVHLENLNQSLPPVSAEIIIVGPEVIFPQSWVKRVEIIAAATFFLNTCALHYSNGPKFLELSSGTA